jgi:hypothetical protein
MYSQQLTEVILPSIQNVVGICKQLTLLSSTKLGKEPQVPTGPQGWSGHSGEEKNSQPALGIEPLNPDGPAHSQSPY